MKKKTFLFSSAEICASFRRVCDTFGKRIVNLCEEQDCLCSMSETLSLLKIRSICGRKTLCTKRSLQGGVKKTICEFSE